MVSLISSFLMQFAGLNGIEWVIIIGLIVAVFFGAKKIPEFARSIGKASGEFEKARLEAKKEIEKLKNMPSATVERAKLEEVANTLGLDGSGKTDEQLRSEIDAAIRKN
jgi:sec-independent protein translocase protein TatA